jgi:hypothetical protein
MCKIFVLCVKGDYNLWGLSTPTKNGTKSKREPTLNAILGLQISTPTEM